MSDAVDRLFLDFQAALAGRYSLERELGRGGMGVVYLAREVRLDRLVAIKLLPPEFAAIATLRERFLREARMAARLSQPNIIPIFAVDEVGPFVFYAMAYVDGETLTHRVQTRGPLPSPEVTRILREVAWALAYAHGAGVVHRDVKPENILMENGSGRVLVADFGIARQAQASGGTGVGEVIGTPDYMSPEQASGDNVDARSDLYSLGVVGFYLLSGRLPFTGSSGAAVMAQHVTATPPPSGTVTPSAPRALCQAIDRCLAKDPRNRFATGEELAEALGDALELRRETPVPVRVFMRNLKAPAILLIWLELGILPSTIVMAAKQSLLGGSLLSLVVFTLPFLVLGYQVRKLGAVGFSNDDVALAFRLAYVRAKEEAQFEYGVEATLWERMAGVISLAGFGTAGVGAFLSTNAVIAGLWVGGLSGALWLIRRIRRKPGESWWARLWSGKVGRWIFRFSTIGQKRVVGGGVSRPTELAIGSAADGLFSELPRETRKALGDLPATIRNLEGHAQKVRARIDQIDQTLAQARQAPRGGGAAATRESLTADLSAAKEAAQRRLAEVVAALETIRLDLLRLRAGAGSVESLTADLTAAREIDEQTNRLLAGHREVEEALRRG